MNPQLDWQDENKGTGCHRRKERRSVVKCVDSYEHLQHASQQVGLKREQKGLCASCVSNIHAQSQPARLQGEVYDMSLRWLEMETLPQGGTMSNSLLVIHLSLMPRQ